MRRSTPIYVATLFILIVTAACAVSGLPSTSPDAVSTIVAATLQAITPEATQTAILPTPVTPTPLLPTLAPSSSSVPPTLQPVSPTLVVPGATRISFLTDATSAIITGPIQAGGTVNYVLQAFQGQPMLVNVDAPNHDITLSIKTQGGTSMLNAAAGQATWQGTLPQTEDYYISLHGGASSENFTLSITIPSRIRFAQGAISGKVRGKTVGGYDSIYTVFAVKGQKMNVDLTNLSGDAALTIYGFTDGQPYVRYVSEQTSFSFTLPSTQDYIIEVVPRAGSVVSFLLNVQIQ
ncbi:MAG: hypothetical protein ACXWNQ_08520 [Anaerolineales bacterium]